MAVVKSQPTRALGGDDATEKPKENFYDEHQTIQGSQPHRLQRP